MEHHAEKTKQKYLGDMTLTQSPISHREETTFLMAPNQQTCGWSPWSGFHPEPAPPQQCKSAPTSLGHHSCSSDSPSHPLACTPSPCRGSGHLGMQKRAAEKKNGEMINTISVNPPQRLDIRHTCTTQELFAKAMMSLSSQKKAESDLLIISNLLSSFIA